MKKLFYILLTALALNLSPNIHSQTTDDHVALVVVVVCKCEHSTECTCDKKVPDALDFVYTVITKDPKKRFDNLSKKGKVYMNEDGEVFTFTGEYIVLKDEVYFLDPFYLPMDEPGVVGTAL